MIRSPQKDMLTTNLKCIKNYREKSMSSFWGRKLCMNQHFTFGWKGLDQKKKKNEYER